MPYDPTLPLNNAQVKAQELRGQFNGLKDLIDALPSITAAVVDGVSTVNPGEAATVTLSVVGQTLHFNFGIPRGQDGPAGPVFGNTVVDGVTTLNPGEAATVQTSFDGSNVRFQFGIPRGNDGSNGTNGSDGMQGPPFTNFVVDGVNTLNPMDPASVQASFDGNAVRLLFGIPRGNDGNNGSDGMQGPPGAPFTNFVVDGVTTLNPNEPATVSAGFDGNAVRLLFGIPRGSEGMQGPGGNDGMQGPPGPPFTNFVVDNVNQLPPGSWPNVSANFDGTAVRLNFGIPQGNDGPQGPTGPQGQPFANAVVDGVTTLNPGDNATVQTNFDGSNVRFQFGIPKGQIGNDGMQGPQGAPGEVTTMQLNSAINTTSANSNAVATLDTPFANDPPTLADMEVMRAKMNELITALRR